MPAVLMPTGMAGRNAKADPPSFARPTDRLVVGILNRRVARTVNGPALQAEVTLPHSV